MSAQFVSTPDEAIVDIEDGASLAVGGFGICGTPLDLIEAIRRRRISDLHIIANNCGIDGAGLGSLLQTGQIRRLTCSYLGTNRLLIEMIRTGRLEIELVPQGTLADKLRLGGAGIAAFYTPTGVGTPVSEGGLPRRYGPHGQVIESSEPKEVREIGGRNVVLEHTITADYALVRAEHADLTGNLRYRLAARNFNPLCAMAARTTIVEAASVLPSGQLLRPDDIHTPGIFVDRVISARTKDMPIERVVLRQSLDIDNQEVIIDAMGSR